jgi:hypothetical protein
MEHERDTTVERHVGGADIFAKVLPAGRPVAATVPVELV